MENKYVRTIYNIYNIFNFFKILKQMLLHLAHYLTLHTVKYGNMQYTLFIFSSN